MKLVIRPISKNSWVGFASVATLPRVMVDWGTSDAGHNQEKNEAVEFLKKQRLLEINPKSPLIEGLLARVEGLDGEEKDLEAEKELKEVASILIDGALVRSGFQVHDSNE